MVRAGLLLCAVLLAGCSWFSDPASPDNPFHSPYAGEPGSVFDSRGALRPVKAEPVYSMTPVPLVTSPAPVSPVPPRAPLPPR